MAISLYVLTIHTTLSCSILLLRAYARVRRALLLWSGLCFIGLTLDSVLVLVDLTMFPSLDLFTWRLGSAAIAVSLLVFGMIWERR